MACFVAGVSPLRNSGQTGQKEDITLSLGSLSEKAFFLLGPRRCVSDLRPIHCVLLFRGNGPAASTIQ